jgi:predicted nucleotidyltransferase
MPRRRVTAYRPMTRLEELIRAVGTELGRSGFAWALVGGLAVSVRAEPRFTRDVDVAVAVEEDAEAETLVMQLKERGLELLASLEQEATGRLATVRLAARSNESGPVLDLLFASSGIEREIVMGADDLEIVPGVHAPVAQTGHLIALKVLSRDDTNRPQDLADLLALISAADPVDMNVAREGLKLIADRGYQRGRELEVDLDRLLRQGQ